MKSVNIRVSAAAFALVVCLSVASDAAAQQEFERPFEIRERIVRALKKFQKVLGVRSLTEYPAPPKP